MYQYDYEIDQMGSGGDADAFNQNINVEGNLA